MTATTLYVSWWLKNQGLLPQGKRIVQVYWGVSILLIATTAAGRVFAIRHFPTDVVAGAWMGILVSYLFFKVSRKPELPHLP
jgi:membrane-associated phospholipid phosphatase